MKKAGHILLFVLLFTAILAISACGSSSDSTPTPTPTPTPTISPTLSPTPTNTTTAKPTSTVTPTPTQVKTMQWSSAPAMSIDQNKQYVATIKTNYGDIVLELFPKDAPLAVNNFVFLARQGYYDGVKFHRVVKDFMIQSGDPTGTGSGTPGYSFADETITREYIAGTLAMANAGKNTNGSQFFICLVDCKTILAKKYTIFGLVSSGMDVVQKIGNVPVKANPRMMNEVSAPTVDVHIDTITIEEK
jgi:cyclophilin family peptidyl-prolyl cis-trans isomerase